jgi:lipopolysaccharide transport system ATP-binding protein
MRRIHELRAAGATILFVSHDAMDVKALCDRCLWLEAGQVRQIGDADEVVANYLQAALHPERHGVPIAADSQTAATAVRRFGDHAAEVVSAEIVDHAGERRASLRAGEPVIVRIGVRAFKQLQSPILGFLVRNKKGESIFGANTAGENYPAPSLEPGDRFAVEFHWVAPQLASGCYSISVAVAEGDETNFQIRDYIEDAVAIDVPPSHPTVHGYLRLDCESATVARS